MSSAIRYCRYIFIFYVSQNSLGCGTVQHGFGTLAGNLGWHVSNAAGKHCSHGCFLSTQADSLLSRPVSRPATHSSWVGGWEKLDPSDTGGFVFGQCCDTPGNGTRHLTFTSRVFAYIFIWFPSCYRRWLWPCVVCRHSHRLQLLCNSTEMLQDPQGPLSLGHM